MAETDRAMAAAKGAKSQGVFKGPKGWTADHDCYDHPEWSKGQCEQHKASQRRRSSMRTAAAADRG